MALQNNVLVCNDNADLNLCFSSFQLQNTSVPLDRKWSITNIELRKEEESFAINDPKLPVW